MAGALVQGLMGAIAGGAHAYGQVAQENERSAAAERLARAKAIEAQNLERVRQMAQTEREGLKQDRQDERHFAGLDNQRDIAEAGRETQAELARMREDGADRRSSASISAADRRAAAKGNSEDPFGPRKLMERGDITARELTKIVEQRRKSIMEGMPERGKRGYDEARASLLSGYGIDPGASEREQDAALRKAIATEVNDEYTSLRDQQVQGYSSFIEQRKSGGSPESGAAGSSEASPVSVASPDQLATIAPGTWVRLPNGTVRQR